MVDETKRPTVAVTCGVRQGLKLQTFDPKRPEVIILKPGLNPGIDKGYYETWLTENSQASVLPLLSHVDEKEESAAAADPWERKPASEDPAPAEGA